MPAFIAHHARMGTPRERGVAMIEVLVAVLIFSVGMIGLLGLLMRSYSMAGSSHFRNIAVLQSQWAADALRANIVNLKLFSAANPQSASPNGNCYSTSGCSEQQSVDTFLASWNDQLTDLLPAATGKVCRGTLSTTGASTCSSSLSGASGVFFTEVCWTPAGVTSGILAGPDCVRTQL
jgi:type IV pilus assembly protein PilV